MKYIYIVIFFIISSEGVVAGSNSVKTIGGKSFQKVIASPKPVFVKFWAPWCGPCRKMAPEYEKASKKFKGRILFTKINIDQNKKLAREYDVQGVPTVIVFKRGKELGRESGYYRSSDIESWAKWSLKQ